MLTHEEKRAWFPDAFYAELDSWFSADIACCDRCYSEFLATWPHAERAEDAAFQRQCIDLGTFYSGSRLRETYSQQEYDEFVSAVTCPRCESPIGPVIWPYNFPFDVPLDFEDHVAAISALAATTPYLLLKHAFAKSTFDLIGRIGQTTKAVPLHHPLYRARRAPIKAPGNLVEYERPPKELTVEGRYNHAGSPALYLASDFETCFAEMRGADCIVAELRIAKAIKILDLLGTSHSHPEHEDSLSALVYSALMSAKQPDSGWHKPSYVFTRFVADCARDAGIQAIRYPSTQIARDNFNLAIIDSAVALSNSVLSWRHCPSQDRDKWSPWITP